MTTPWVGLLQLHGWASFSLAPNLTRVKQTPKPKQGTEPGALILSPVRFEPLHQCNTTAVDGI